mgnify:CR=1 FL=1
METDNYHKHEALDRTHMILVMIEEFLITHQWVEQNPDVLEKLDEASALFAQAYQMIGSKP